MDDKTRIELHNIIIRTGGRLSYTKKAIPEIEKLFSEYYRPTPAPVDTSGPCKLCGSFIAAKGDLCSYCLAKITDCSWCTKKITNWLHEINGYGSNQTDTFLDFSD